MSAPHYQLRIGHSNGLLNFEMAQSFPSQLDCPRPLHFVVSTLFLHFVFVLKPLPLPLICSVFLFTFLLLVINFFFVYRFKKEPGRRRSGVTERCLGLRLSLSLFVFSDSGFVFLFLVKKAE